MFKVIALIAVTLASTGALAGDMKSTQGANATFKSLDRDADGRLSQSEATNDGKLSGQFAALDANADGYLNKREFDSYQKQQRKQSKHPMQNEQPGVY
jgi:Ca2+-binding EF-hand superfamily protein